MKSDGVEGVCRCSVAAVLLGCPARVALVPVVTCEVPLGVRLEGRGRIVLADGVRHVVRAGASGPAVGTMGVVAVGAVEGLPKERAEFIGIGGLCGPGRVWMGVGSARGDDDRGYAGSVAGSVDASARHCFKPVAGQGGEVTPAQC